MRTRLFSMVIVGSLAAAAAAGSGGSAPAQATVTSNADSAISYAHGHGYRSSIGVLDTQTGAFWGAGDYNSAYASESVMKVFIATRLLLTNQMSGWNETTAYKMITQSDDASANALYGRAGGDSVITWVKQALNIPNLGSPPLRSGWWGGTQINAYGMALFYKAVRARPAVWAWLGNAMHHATDQRLGRHLPVLRDSQRDHRGCHQAGLGRRQRRRPAGLQLHRRGQRRPVRGGDPDPGR